MVEHSKVNLDRCVRVYGSVDTESWTGLLDWRKDWWPMKLFQFGNAGAAHRPERYRSTCGYWSRGQWSRPYHRPLARVPGTSAAHRCRGAFGADGRISFLAVE